MPREDTAYVAFEKMVLYLYDHELLTLGLLDHIANYYRQAGVTSPGSLDVQAQDGKDLSQVCITLVDPTFSIAIKGSSEDHEEYWEREQRAWEGIVRSRWGWRTLRV
jgi:hypothetical protein